VKLYSKFFSLPWTRFLVLLFCFSFPPNSWIFLSVWMVWSEELNSWMGVGSLSWQKSAMYEL
jgi:hypothetical protein